MRVLFMGTPSYATTILKALLADESIEVVGLVCQPDKPVGRKLLLTPPDTKAYLQAHHPDIPLFQPQSLRAPEAFEELAATAPKMIVVAAYGKILPPSLLALAPCVNLHASILPKYRGASPIQEMLLHGDALGGVSAMRMAEGLDTGDILAMRYVTLSGRAFPEAWELLSDAAALLCQKVLHAWPLLRPLPQCGADASHCRKIKKSDGAAVFDDARHLVAKWRAYCGWPGVLLPSGLKLVALGLHEENGAGEAGRIVEIGKQEVVVECSLGRIVVMRVQPPSKGEMDAASYVRGRRWGCGDTFL